MAESIVKRLVSRVKPNEKGCLEWQGGRTIRGYGQLSSNGRKLLTHREAYKAFVGPIPEGLQVCHECDNPPCINPDHLFLGTAKENSADMLRKGRMPRGSTHHNAKLSDDDVAEIRRLYERGLAFEDIGNRFGVSAGTVENAVTGKTYGGRGLAGKRKLAYRGNGGKKLTKDQAFEIKALLEIGMKGRHIAARFGIRENIVCDIKHRRTWRLEDIPSV